MIILTLLLNTPIIMTGTAFYFTLGVQKRVEEELNATFTISGYTASLVDQQSVFGIALWLSGGAAAATLIAFGIFTAAACGSIGAQSAKYRQSVYY